VNDEKRQRLLRWAALAQLEHVDVDGGFETRPGLRVKLGDTITVHRNGALEFSSTSIDAAERWLILRWGMNARSAELEAVRLPLSPTHLPRDFVAQRDGSLYTMLRNGIPVATVSPDLSVAFANIVDADPQQLWDSLLDPQGQPLFSVPAEPPRPLYVSQVTDPVAHTRPRQCPGPSLTVCEGLVLGNWETLVRCTQCGALFSVGWLDYSEVFRVSRRKARKLFPEADALRLLDDRERDTL